MPPKRPAAAPGLVRAAAKAGAKAKAKAKARVGGVRPGGGRLRPPRRRPSARTEEVAGSGDSDFTKGEVVESQRLGPLAWNKGLFVAFEGTYWQGPASVAGIIVGYQEAADGRFVELDPKGTNSPRLLEWHSANPTQCLRVHLCPHECAGDLCGDDLFHGMKVKQVKEEDRLPWMSSLVEVPRDELPHLRGLLADGEDVREAKVEDKKKSRSSSSEKKKEKRKKKRKKEKKADRELRRKKESAEDGRRAKERSGGAPLLKGQKKLEDVFGGTGLDPSPTVRRRVKRKAREAARKSAKKSSSSSSSSSDSSSLSGQSHEGLFPESRKVKGIAKRSPGALACQAVEEMKENLLTTSGQMWHMDQESPVPPLCLHYFRNSLKPKMSGGLAREALTLSYLVDLSLQGRIAESLDVALQRLKSLELSANGTDFRISQRLELAPTEVESVTSPVERKEALSEAREEAKLRAQSGKGGDWWKSDGWKKGGDWERKGGGKNKDNPKGYKGDGKKGDREKEEKGGKRKENDKK